MLANSLLSSRPLSDWESGYDAYYIFTDGEFKKVNDSSTLIDPATMFIAYKGQSPASHIAAPNLTVGVETVAIDNLDVYATNGQVHINNFSGVAKIYTLNGANVMDKRVDGEANFSLTNGTYIIQTGNKATIVIVR